MHKILVFLTSVSIMCCSVGQAEPFGLGIIVGAPTGISAKYFLTKRTAIDGALSWFGDTVGLHSDYLWHKMACCHVDGEPLDFYYGFGGRFWQHDKKDEHRGTLGVRGPIGLRYFFRQVPLELFGEIALVMMLLPGTYLSVDLGIGVRYFF